MLFLILYEKNEIGITTSISKAKTRFWVIFSRRKFRIMGKNVAQNKSGRSKEKQKSISEETNEKKKKTDKRIMLWMSVLICKVKIKSIL